ncbi:MAG: glycosyltransferase [Phycisphaerales bacterium]|nr:glycosyltransferase [Phycisphaerales bacterium]
MPPLAVIIPTHTTRHLRRTLLGVAHQSRRPDAVVVTCDNDDAEIALLVEACAAELALLITLVQRPHTGAFRLAQVRNNGVRALMEAGFGDDCRVVFLDGDCCPSHGAMEGHERVGAEGGGGGRGADLVIGFRVDLTPEQTEGFDEAAVRSGKLAAEPTAEQWELLRRRERRYKRHLIMRRLGIGKPHKPKPLGANHSVTLRSYKLVNGYDEEFQFYGCEDDDFGRRLYRAARPLPYRAAVGIIETVVLHQWHPTSAPKDWTGTKGAELLKADRPARARYGLDSPLPQDRPVVTRFAGAAVGTNHE